MKYNLNEEFKVLQQRYLKEFYDANQMKFIERVHGIVDVAFLETSKYFGGLVKKNGKVDVTIDFSNAYNKYLNRLSNLYDGKPKVQNGIQYISFKNKDNAVKFYNMIKQEGEENGVSLSDLSAVKEEQKSRLLVFKDSFFVVEYKIFRALFQKSWSNLIGNAGYHSFFRDFQFDGMIVTNKNSNTFDIKIDELIKRNASVDFWKYFNKNSSTPSNEYPVSNEPTWNQGVKSQADSSPWL